MNRMAPISVLTAAFLSLLVAVSLAADAPGPLTLWYRQPAAQWGEALPLGNGRLGAMVFGGAAKEHLQLNEDTLWSGGPKDWNNPKAKEVLPKVRKAIFEGDYRLADTLCKQMQGPYNQSYQPLGDLYLDFDGSAQPTEYYRDLDLDRAVATVRYKIGDATFTRQAFSSFPDQVIVLRLTCDRPGKLGFRVRLDSLLRHETKAVGPARLLLKGKCPKHVDPSYLGKTKSPIIYDDDPRGEGMTFALFVHAIVNGGEVKADGNAMRVSGANGATLILSADTSYNGFDKSPGRQGIDPTVEALRPLEAAVKKPYAKLLADHVADHQRLFRRVELDLGAGDAPALPTDERLKRYADGNDLSLFGLIFQFGRYLLITSSRPGTQPANLQGIWNDKMRPPWSSNWTLNINSEMNYWPAEVCNLAECHEPMLDFIADLAANGRKTARINYGCRGWVAHHNADLWRHSGPVGNWGAHGQPTWANWAMGGVWHTMDLWEAYAFGGDKDYLAKRAYPLMKGAAEFCLDWLIPDGKGHLVTAPASSTENRYKTPEGYSGQVSMATTQDMVLIWDLFTNCIRAAEVLGIDTEFREELKTARSKLYPLKIGRHGQLQEWAEDWDDPNDHHRHLSHLIGMYPGRRITPRGTPKLAAAVRKSLEMRGDGGTGWSMAWKVNLWARLLDGDHAFLLLNRFVKTLRPNLFNPHAGFQIDANFGVTSGLAEMLVQSHAGEIELLPALPKVWPAGSVKGLCARDGFEVDVQWRQGRLTRATIRSRLGWRCNLRYGPKTTAFDTRPGQAYTIDAQTLQPTPSPRQ